MKINPQNLLFSFGCCVLLCMPSMAEAYGHGASMVGAPHAQSPNAASSTHPDAFIRNMHHQEFLDAKKCQMNYLNMTIMQNKAKICSSSKDLNATFCADNQKAMESSRSAQSATVCSGDPKVLEKNFLTSVKTAAREGDPDAQICYINGAFYPSANVNIEQYKKRASRYLQRSVRRGDWRAVALLTTGDQTIAHGGAGLMTSLNIIGKPFTIYRGYRLLELGSTDGLKMEYARKAKLISSKLTSAQIVNANVWAANMYMHHFNHLPLLSSPPKGCDAN